MPRVDDKWEKLVEAVLDREKLRALAYADSSSESSSFRSSFSSSSFSSSNFDFIFNSPDNSATSGPRGRFISVPTYFAYQVIKAANTAALFKAECLWLKEKTQQLQFLLQEFTCVTDIHDDFPTRRIMDVTKGVLDQALVLVLKCQEGSLRRRLFTKITPAAFHAIVAHLENTISNVSLHLDKLIRDTKLINILKMGSVDERCEAVASLVSLVRDHHFFRNSFIDDGGIRSLSKFLEEGTMEGQEHAVRAVGWLLKDPKSVQQMTEFDFEDLFCGILKDGPIRVQAAVAWVISEIAGNGHIIFPTTVELLISHLAFDGVQFDNSNYTAYVGNLSTNIGEGEAPENADHHALKVYIVEMAAKAIFQFIKSGNETISSDGRICSAKAHCTPEYLFFSKYICKCHLICRNILNSSALSHLAILLDKGPKESNYVLIKAMMEITEFIERCGLFTPYSKPTSLIRKAIVDILLRAIDTEDALLLVPCIKIVGNLAVIFEETEMRVRIPLVKLLKVQKPDVCKQACIALAKFISCENQVTVVCCKEIFIAYGVKYLVQLVHFGDEIVQIPALILLCYVVLHMPESKEIADAKVLHTLEWAEQCKRFVEDKHVERILPEALRNIKVPI